MVIINFENVEMEKKALDFLVGRCSFKTWDNGDLMLPERGRLGSWPPRASLFEAKGRPRMSISYRRYEILLPRQFNAG